MTDSEATTKAIVETLGFVGLVAIIAALFVGDVMEWFDNRRSKRRAVRERDAREAWTVEDEDDYQRGVNVKPSPGPRPPYRNLPRGDSIEDATRNLGELGKFGMTAEQAERAFRKNDGA